MRVKKGRLQNKKIPVKVATVTETFLFLVVWKVLLQGRDSFTVQMRKLRKETMAGSPSSMVVRVLKVVTHAL